MRPWHGGFITVHCGALGRSDRVALRCRDRALSMLGLRELERGLFVRPDNLQGDLDQVRRRLHSLGLEPEASVFIAGQFDPERSLRIQQLWRHEHLNVAYASTQAQLAEWTARAPTLGIEEAARESYLLGRKAIRQLVFDPWLPEPLVDVSARARFVQAVTAFDAMGHDIWRQLHALLDTPACA